MHQTNLTMGQRSEVKLLPSNKAVPQYTSPFADIYHDDIILLKQPANSSNKTENRERLKCITSKKDFWGQRCGGGGGGGGSGSGSDGGGG